MHLHTEVVKVSCCDLGQYFTAQRTAARIKNLSRDLVPLVVDELLLVDIRIEQVLVRPPRAVAWTRAGVSLARLGNSGECSGPLREEPAASLSSDCDLVPPPFVENKITSASALELHHDACQ